MANTQERLASFVTSMEFAEFDPVAIARAKDAIIDTIGVGIAGTKEEVAETADLFFESTGDFRDEGGSFLLGNTRRLTAPNAALYNGLAIHALDFDDIAHPANAHLSASIVSALLAVVPADEILSDRFVTAYVAGYEVGAKFGRVLIRSRRNPGWHQTGTIGPIAATVAVAKALDLDATQIQHALGMAASSSAGLLVNLGSMTKPFHAGRGAQAGVIDAMMAAQGFTSSPDAYDSPKGFFRTFGVGDSDELRDAVETAWSQLGDPWELATDIGIALKPFPSCAGTHCAIEATLQIRGAIDVDDIEEIYVGMSQASTEPLVFHRPELGLQGKFSMEYCVGAAMTRGSISIDSFSDDRVNDPAVLAVMDKIRTEVDDRVRTNKEHGAVVEVTTKSGKKHEVLIELAKGKPARWLSPEEVRGKFDDCVTYGYGAAIAGELYDALTSNDAKSRKRLETLLVGKS